MEKILHLTLKRKWFDMIASGKKKEEYREIKPYWTNRLKRPERQVEVDEFQRDFNEFDYVVFKNGYAKDAREMKVECIIVRRGFGRNEWGATPSTMYYIIQLGKIISKNF